MKTFLSSYHKNCAKCGKDLEFGTNEAFNFVDQKFNLGISKILTFCLHANMAAPNTGIPLKRKSSRKLFACIQRRKELIKLIKKDPGTTLIGSVVTKIFNPKDT